MPQTLTQGRMVDFETWRKHQLLLAQGNKAFTGGIAIGNPSTGKVQPGPSLSGGLFLGLFSESLDTTSTGLNADTPVNIDFIQELRVVWLDNDGSVTAASIFNPAYIVDDHTVSTSTSGGSRTLGGTILAVDTVLGVAVAIGRAFLDNE